MTFDDGILTIYQIRNRAEPGMKPELGLREKEKFYFGFDTLGIQRYYTALQARQQIEAVVKVPGWYDIKSTDICILENEVQYRIAMIQFTREEDGLKITKLSLERLGEDYVVEM